MPHPEANSLGNSYYYLSLLVGCSNSSLNFVTFLYASSLDYAENTA